MRTAGVVLIALAVVIPGGWWLYSAALTRLENRRYGGPPMEDAFGPVARYIDALILLTLFAVFALPGVALLIWGG